MPKGHFPLQYLQPNYMKSNKFRRSQNVEDYRDPNKPVLPPELDEFAQSIADQMTQLSLDSKYG